MAASSQAYTTGAAGADSELRRRQVGDVSKQTSSVVEQAEEKSKQKVGHLHLHTTDDDHRD